MRIKHQRRMKKITCVSTLLCAGLLLNACGTAQDAGYTAQGMEAVEALDYEAALDFFHTAQEKEEDERLLYRGIGIAYMGMTDYDQAIAYLEAALQLSDGNVEEMDYDMNYYLATAYYKNGQAAEAVGVYDAILALRPKEKDAWYLRGCVKLSQDDFDGAQSDFDMAIALDRQDYDRLIQIYMVLEEYGYKEAGQGYLQNAISENGKSVSDYDMGRIYFYLEDYENARDCLTKMKTDTDYGAALYLGRTYEALGDYNYASSIYAGYTENDQSQPQIYNQLGLCRMRMGEYELALDAFHDAMQIEDNDMLQTLKFNEIVAYEYMEDYKTAAALMNSYLKAYPDDEQAKREYKFLQTR